MPQSHSRTNLGDAGKSSKGKETAPEGGKRKVRAAIMLGVIAVLLVGAYFVWWREPPEKDDFVPVPAEQPALTPDGHPKPPPGQPVDPPNAPPRKIIAG